MTGGQVRDQVPGHGSGGQGCTGILLVGGASERFGSPKALARFRGETLAERAWHVLGEACEEVIAVGKSEHTNELPFPVLDDGSDDRAPVFGVSAGLRAARYDVCLALPVDTPLVTPDLLRELLAARAVPQTGPLPGVYTRSMLPELDQRVSAGELSLRGVNPNVIDVNEAQLLNVNTPTDLIVAAAEALDTSSQGRPVALPDEAAMLDLSSDFWSTALWAARKLRKGEVFAAVDGVNGAMKRSLVTLLSWHARAVDADADVWDAGRFLERWADPGALAALERAYAHYDLRDVARALWETVDLFQGLEEDTARRLGLALELDHTDLRRRVAEIVRDPRHGATL
ncbi:MAG TPA: NTP transferase domain-containing protein [Gaiellaceae bacterium]|nr:NTP transferase domain-containing protein [Gaiellaceae bacterium]